VSTYFHFTMTRLDPGSIILPGNWGRLLHRYQHKNSQGGQIFGQVFVLFREVLVEGIRAEHFHALPSRFYATFCLPDLEAAERYRAAHDPSRLQVLHEVEITAESLPTHVGFLSDLAWPQEDNFLGPMKKRAHDYWSKNGQGDIEIVSASPLRVVRAVD
jgi:hypothetical protein